MLDYVLMGKRIRARRMELGLTQENIADAAGLANNTVSNIENGKTKVSLPTLLEIANFLSVSLDDVVWDSLNKSDHVYYKQMNQLLETCTNDEKRGAVEIVASYIKVVHG